MIEWKSVDDELPSNNKICLLFQENHCYITGWHEFDAWFDYEGKILNKITHWTYFKRIEGF